MDKESFEKITSKLNERLGLCQKFLDPIEDGKPIKQMTVQDAIDLRQFCHEEEAIQTRILQIDLYHIIGMGNLSAPQVSSLARLIHEYCSYRTDIHVLSAWNGSILNLPKVPARSEFKLHEFDLTLISGRSGELIKEDDVVVDEKDPSKVVEEIETETESVADLPGTYKKGRVVFTKDEKEAIAELFTQLPFTLEHSKEEILKNINLSTTNFGGLHFYHLDGMWYAKAKDNQLGRKMRGALDAIYSKKKGK